MGVDRALAGLLADPVVQRVGELRLELPYDFVHDDYAQILEDAVRRVAPALGWEAAAPPPRHGAG